MFPVNLLSLEVMLPFFLVLAVIYGVLGVSNVFKNRAVNGIIALVFAFFSIMNPQVVSFINSILPYAAGLFVILFIIALVLKPLKGSGGIGGIDPVLFIVIIVLALVAIARFGDEGYLQNTMLSDPNLLWIGGFLVIILIFWKAYKMGGES